MTTGVAEHSSLPGSAATGSDTSSLGARILAAPATWLLAIVGLSTLVRGLIVARVPAPWILPDEVVYSELAKSIAQGGRPAIRGVPVFGWGEVYPTLVAPAWAIFDDPFVAYHAALVLNAFVMSLAAIPAYALARMFVLQRSALLVAVMTVLVPSMAYTGVVMTENAFYPVFVLALLLIARVIRTPSLANQALVLGGLGLVALTRIQGVALVGAYAVGVVLYALLRQRGERRRYLTRFLPSLTLALAVSVAPMVASVARGDGPFGWLGARSGTFDSFRPGEIPKWFVFLGAGLVLYVAVAPAIATALVAGRGMSRGATEPLRLFAAVALPTFGAMLFSVALVSASLDVDGTENLNERYVFYVVPLLLLGLAIWIQSGLPRPRTWAWVALVAFCLVPALLPMDQLEYNAGFQSLAILPWASSSLSGVGLFVAVAAFTSICGAIWATSRARTAGRLWFLVGVTFVLVATGAYLSNSNSSTNSGSAFLGKPATWVDDAVPAGTQVPVLWDARLEGAYFPGEAYFWLMVTELLNPSVGDVHRLGPRTYYETFLPTVPVRETADGRVLFRDGTAFRPRRLLVACWHVGGRVIDQAPRGILRLVELEGPVRLLAPRPCGRR